MTDRSRWRPGPLSPSEDDEEYDFFDQFATETGPLDEPDQGEPTSWWRRGRSAPARTSPAEDDDGPPTLAPGFGTAAPAYGRSEPSPREPSAPTPPSQDPPRQDPAKQDSPRPDPARPAAGEVSHGQYQRPQDRPGQNPGGEDRAEEKPGQQPRQGTQPADQGSQEASNRGATRLHTERGQPSPAREQGEPAVAVPAPEPGHDEAITPDAPADAAADTATRPSARRLLGATAIMAAGTIMSRILGLVRVVLAAWLLGTNTRQADILSVATTVPNSLYILFAGGALNTVLVPQLVRAVKNDKDGGEAYTNRIMTAFLILVGVVAVVLTVAAPLLAWIYSDSAWHTDALAPHFRSMVLLTALCLPQVFFYGAFFLGGQVLNARDEFGPMMWAPIANNVVQVVVLAAYAVVWGSHTDTSAPFSTPQALLLGIGSVLGIAVQSAVLVPFMRKVGFRYRPRFDLRHTGLGHTFHLAKWTLGFVAVNQVALLIVTKLATSATAGGEGAGITTYNNANLLWVLPHSLITVGLATAMLPSLSRMAASDELDSVRTELTTAIRMAVAALAPVALLYLAIGIPIAELAFRGPGKGGDLVGWTLMLFAVGLLPFSVQYLVLRAYYAFEDTRSTFFLQLLIAGLNAVLALVLVLAVSPGAAWVAPMLALSYTLAYVVGLVVSLLHFRRLVPGLALGGLASHVGKVLLAALPGTVVAAGLVWFQARRWDGLVVDLLGLAVGAAVAVGGYLAMARVLHVSEVEAVVGMVRRRLGRGAAPADRRDVTDDAPAETTETGEEPEVPTSETEPERTAVVALPRSGDPDLPLDDPEPGTPADVSPGDIFGGRYRLDERIVVRGTTSTWKAYDQVLSRAALVHVLAPDNPRRAEILDAARTAARATDSRFLRVLDAVDDEGYIVCEYTEGLLLETLLASGPLTSLEAAWAVRELADALAAVHAAGLTHQRLNPGSVVVSTTGNVKIIGLSIDAALHPRSATDVSPERHEAQDVRALGSILYACLCQRWPGADGFGLPAAPTAPEGGLLPPAKVRPGVSPALNRITADILTPGSPGLSTAAAIAAELTAVLGSADASSDLSQRVRDPHTAVREPAVIVAPVPAATPAQPEPAVAQPARVVSEPEPDGEPTGPVRTATAVTGDERPRRRVPVWVLPLVALVVTGIVLGLWFGNRTTPEAGRPGSTGGQSASASPSQSGPYAIAGAKDFDPSADNGSNDENPNQVSLAYDGDPATAWTTLTYKGNPKLGGLKAGVGLVLDLGRPVLVGSVRLTLQGQPTDVELRVPSTQGATAAPMDSQKSWRTVAKVAGAGTTAELKPDQPVTSQYVLVYLTSLPAASGGYRGAVAEVQVNP